MAPTFTWCDRDRRSVITIRTAGALTVWVAGCALSACGPQSSPTQSLSPSPAVSTAAVTDPTTAFLTVDQVNAIVVGADPHATKVSGPEPIAHQPDSPYDGIAAPCGRSLPLYFGAGEPPLRGYAKWTAAGQGNAFVNQLVAQYVDPGQASTRFAQLTKDVPACADATATNPDSGLAVKAAAVTANSVQFQQGPGGANRQLSGSHVANTEYRLLGNSIIGVSATQPAAVVSNRRRTARQEFGWVDVNRPILSPESPRPAAPARLDHAAAQCRRWPGPDLRRPAPRRSRGPARSCGRRRALGAPRA